MLMTPLHRRHIYFPLYDRNIYCRPIGEEKNLGLPDAAAGFLAAATTFLTGAGATFLTGEAATFLAGTGATFLAGAAATNFLEAGTAAT